MIKTTMTIISYLGKFNTRNNYQKLIQMHVLDTL